MYLIFDVGGTHTRLSISEDGIDLFKTEVFHTPKFFDDFLKLVRQFTNGSSIKKVSGGLAGVLDKEKRMLLKSNLPEWNYQPIADSLEDIFNCKIILENDAALGALGEATHGAGINSKIMAYMTIGTGVGGARIIDKKIDQNTFGFEPGHQIVSASGPLCPFCKSHGHLASYISGYALYLTHDLKPEDIVDPEVWDEVTKKLALGLSNMSVFWSPDTIVLAGSVTKKVDIKKLADYLDNYLTIFPDKPKIVKAKLEHPGLYGALEYLKQLN